MEVVRTMQGDVLGRLPTEEEERNPQLRSILLRRSAAHPLHAGVVGDVLASLQHFATFNLPALGGIVDVVQTVSMQSVRKGCTRTCPKRQVEWCGQPAAAPWDEEVHERAGWIIEAHHIGSVLGCDVEVVVRTKRNSDRDV